MRLAGTYDLLLAPGPVATLTLTGDPGDPGDRGGWSGLRRRLRAAGAGPAVLATLDARAASGAARVVVVGEAGDLRLDAAAPPGTMPRAVWGPLPALLPLLAHRCRSGDPDGAAESDALHRFVEQRGRSERVTEGLAGVVRALRQGGVQTLLVTEHLDPGQLAWFGPRGRDVAVERSEIEEPGAARVQRAPAADVLLRAACAAGADLVVTTEQRVVLGGEPAALLCGGSGRPGAGTSSQQTRQGLAERERGTARS